MEAGRRKASLTILTAGDLAARKSARRSASLARDATHAPEKQQDPSSLAIATSLRVSTTRLGCACIKSAMPPRAVSARDGADRLRSVPEAICNCFGLRQSTGPNRGIV